MNSLFSSITILLLLSSSLTWAGNWPGFRGPNFDGSNSETKLPAEISKTTHVSWKADLSGSGASTPAVWGQSVFVTSINKKGNGVVANKINLSSGEIEWSREFSKTFRRDRRSQMAGPSPTTNGECVIFLSGSGDLAAYDFDGELLWQTNLQKEYGAFSLKWTYSSSPVLNDGSLYIQVLQRNESIDGVIPGRSSYLLSINPKTGAENWLHTRHSAAVGESLEAYSSPVPVTHRGRKEILISGADCLTGHNPETGDEIWRWGTWNRKRANDWRVIPSPVYGDDMIVACAPKGQPVYTFFAGSDGTVNLGDLKWKSKIDVISCDVTTPLFYDGHFYFVNGRKKIISCVEPYSGKIEWTQPIPARAKIEASPTGADGKVYVISHTGEVFIYRASAKYELLHTTVLGQDSTAKNRASIVPAKGRLLIRLGSTLWCMD